MRFLFLLLTCLVFLIPNTKAQKLDESFHPVFKGFPIIRSTYQQTDGKILISGNFIFTDNKPVKNLVRINSDGTIDDSFNPPPIERETIQNAVASEGGQIILHTWDGKLMALHEDGSRDEQFIFGTTNLMAYNIWPRGNSFYILVHESENGFAFYRILSDGSIDPSFSKSYLNNLDGRGIRDIDTLNDGRVIIIGNFTEYNNVDCNGFLLLNENGTIDTSFDPGTGFGVDFDEIDIQAQQNKIIVAGDISKYNGISFPKGIIRLNLDGSIDEGFVMGPVGGLFNNYPEKIQIDSDNKILVAGKAWNPSSMINYYIYRLNPDGSIDNSFNTPELEIMGYDDLDLNFDLENNIIAGADFKKVNGEVYCGIVKLDNSGNIIPGFDAQLRESANITDAIKLDDGKIMVIGDFIEIDTSSINSIARLNNNGLVDKTFAPDFELKNNDKIESIAVQEDGHILIGGYFSEIKNWNDLLLRLNDDGTLDQSFLAEVPALYVGIGVTDIKILENEKIIIGGSFEYVNNSARNRIARLNPDGSLDTEFNKNNIIDEDFRIKSIDILEGSGEILLGGEAVTPTWSLTGKIIMIDSLGELVSAFNTNNNSSNLINDILSLDGSKFIYGGYPSGGGTYGITKSAVYISDKYRDKIDSLSITGLHENNLATFLDFHRIDSASLLLGGYFTEVNGFQNSGLTKVKLNGGVDIHFRFNVKGGIEKILPYDEEHILIFGKFAEINENPYYSAAKVKINNYLPVLPEELEITVNEDSIMEFTASELDIYDEDDSLSDISVTYLSGENYIIENNKIIPVNNYSGNLVVNARISDEKDTVDVVINLNILPVNDPPKILALKNELSIINTTSLTLSNDMFEIVDPDNNPDEIELVLQEGGNYWFENQIINVPERFFGDLTVNVKATDGIDEGENFEFNVRVATITSLEKLADNSINIFPNPVNNGVLNILNNLTDQKIRNVKLFDLSGKTILNVMNPDSIEKSTTIDLNGTNPGLYILSVQSEDISINKKIKIE